MTEPGKTKRIAWSVAGLLAGAALVGWLLLPAPVEVDVEAARRAPVVVAVDEDGETRARDRYVIAAPVAGRLLRIDLHEGDPVRAGQAVAQMAPTPLAASERENTAARLRAAQAQAVEAGELAARAKVALAQARSERRRLEQLVTQRFVSDQALEQARLAEAARQRDVDAALARVRAAEADAAAVRALLMPERGQATLLALVAPVDGRVLRVHEKSERVLAVGSPVMTVGDATQLEIVVDVLSSDAARIRPGMRVSLTNWGGPEIADARVRTVEPAAFTKVSALGVEEQRVNVIIDLPPQLPAGAILGDAYRVEARIVLAEAADTLSVPAAAIFRRGTDATGADTWAAFVLEGGRIRLRMLQLGLRGATRVQVLGGLAEGEPVVLYPGNDVAEGVRARARQARAATSSP
jgi:HlyD family secretion protein